MCMAGLFVLAANMIANSAVFRVVKEQVSGSTIPEDFERETAFVD